MNTKKSIVILLFLFLVINLSFGQINIGQKQVVIKGKITDAETKRPIVGANAIIEKFNKGAKSDKNGNYMIKLPGDLLDEGDRISIFYSAKNYRREASQFFFYDNSTELNISLDLKKETNFSNIITQIYNIRFREPQEIFQIIQPYLNPYEWASATVSHDLKTITVKDREEVHQKIRDVIKQYDAPLKKIWMKVTIIKASENGKQKENFPEEVEDVIIKLNELFNFDNYEIVGWGDAMGVEGSQISFRASNIVEPKNGSFSAKARLGFFENIIKLEQFRVNMPSGNDLVTTINVKNGETVVVGASRTNNIKQGSLITVVTAKVIE